MLEKIGGRGRAWALAKHTHTLRALEGCFLIVENAVALGHSFLSAQHKQLLPRRQQVLQKHSGKDLSHVRQSM
jgi:hypothetical protein